MGMRSQGSGCGVTGPRKIRGMKETCIGLPSPGEDAGYAL